MASLTVEVRTSLHGFVYQGNRRMLYMQQDDGSYTLSACRGWRPLTTEAQVEALKMISDCLSEEET